MKIKKISVLIVFLSVGVLGGCQSYPKNPSTPSIFDSKVEVNKAIPAELDGVNFELVKYSEKPTKSNKSSGE